jgi:hypothetical protein
MTATLEVVSVIRGDRQRRPHKAFLRYHDAENWPLLREALQRMGRADLIGNGKKHLIPSFQPAGTGTILQRAGTLSRQRHPSLPGAEGRGTA